MALPLVALLLSACGGTPALTGAEMDASYERALERTATLSVENPGGDPGARQALARAEDFFDAMNAATVPAKALATYAPGAYLNDNMAVVEGAEAIGDYFLRTLQRTAGLDVDFLDAAHDGIDYFVRWRMTVSTGKLNDGAPMVSYGMSHFRFDENGRILLHRDFWDAGTGLYEYLPVLGPVLRRVRAMAEEES